MNRHGSGTLWLLSQSWEHLLFAHWQENAAAISRLLPAPLTLDTFQGSAWVSLVVMRVRAVHPLALLPGPLLAPFAQLNWRTYVRYKGRPAVYFLKLQAASAASLAGGRLLYRLPYSYAPLSLSGGLGTLRLKAPGLECAYHAAGPARRAHPGTVDHWLLERYASFSISGRTVLRADLDHHPWEVSDAAADLDPIVSVVDGLTVAGRPDLMHYSNGMTAKISRPFCYP